MQDPPRTIEQLLHSIQSKIESFPEGSDVWRKLFSAYWRQQLEKVSAMIESDACHRAFSVQCADFEASAEIVLEGISLRSCPEVRNVWAFSAEERLFDDMPWRRYFECTARQIEEGRLCSMNTLLVLANDATLADTRVHWLLRFFKRRNEYCCKWLSVDKYAMAQEKHGFGGMLIDFAVFGRDVVFQTTGYEPPEGLLIGNGSKVGIYTQFFDDLWLQAADVRSLVAEATPLSLEELISLDQEEDIEGT